MWVPSKRVELLCLAAAVSKTAMSANSINSVYVGTNRVELLSQGS